jgi:alkylhydroperoxidase AhpD family core domain
MSAQPRDIREPFIPIPNGRPGLGGLVSFKPQSGSKLNELAQQLLRGPSPLSEGERELIAAHVSRANDCYFCAHVHGAVAVSLLGVESADDAPVSDKLRTLLHIAGKVRGSGLDVTPADVLRARAAGASAEDIHDTVLIAAAFCMFNRYVDGLAATTPRDDHVYTQLGGLLAGQGYLRSS